MVLLDEQSPVDGGADASDFYLDLTVSDSARNNFTDAVFQESNEDSDDDGIVDPSHIDDDGIVGPSQSEPEDSSVADSDDGIVSPDDESDADTLLELTEPEDSEIKTGSGIEIDSQIPQAYKNIGNIAKRYGY